MSPDKLANSDKLGGGADFDDKKPGSPHITTRLALSGPALLAVLLLAGAVAFGHTSGFFESAPSGDTGTAAAADAPAASTPKPDAINGPMETDRAVPTYGADEDELALARRTPKPEPVEVAPKPEPETQPEPKPETQPEPAKYIEPAPQPAPPAPTTT